MLQKDSFFNKSLIAVALFNRQTALVSSKEDSTPVRAEPHNVASCFSSWLAIWIVIAATWGCFVFLAPTTVGWRDSGEFLISPFLLDIVHPAGFPTYSQLGNAFTLLPYGPIGWRVHLFSGVSALLFISSSLLCLFEMMKAVNLGSPAAKLTGSIICVLAILHSEIFWKGALSAEVYLLNGTLVILCLAGLVRYSVVRDSRILLTMAFGGGLACGNHVAFGFIALFSLPALIAIKVPGRTVFAALVLGIIGLCVYGYIPSRALASPPLNTGSVTSVERFINQVTNARDSALRPAGTGGEGRISQSTLTVLGKDLRKSLAAIPPVSLLFILTGAGLLLCCRPAVLLACGGTGLGTLLFFSGWDGDPWTPVLGVAGIIAGLGSGAIIESVSKRIIPLIAFPILAGSMFLSPSWKPIPESVWLGSGYETPANSGRALLDSIPRDRLLITEPSWFVLRYLTIVEGYRDDIVLAYQPQLIFSGLFAPFRILTPSGDTFFSQFDPEKLGAADIKSAARLIDLASQSGPVFIEPTAQLFEAFHALLQLRQGNLPMLVRGEPGISTPEYFLERQRFFEQLAGSVRAGGPLFSRDAQNYLEVLLGLEVNLLSPVQALALYESVCGKKGDCSSRTLNNFGLAAMSGADPCRAVEVLTRAVETAPPMIAGTINGNLELAKAQCGRAAYAVIPSLPRNPLYGR